MPRHTMIRVSQLDAIQEEIRGLPPRAPEEISCGEAIAKLSPELRALRHKGYSWALIREILKQKGLVVTEAVLKKRLGEHTDGTARPKRGRRSATSAADRASGRRQEAEAGTAHATAGPAPESAPTVGSPIVGSGSETHEERSALTKDGPEATPETTGRAGSPNRAPRSAPAREVPAIVPRDTPGQRVEPGRPVPKEVTTPSDASTAGAWPSDVPVPRKPVGEV